MGLCAVRDDIDSTFCAALCVPPYISGSESIHVILRPTSVHRACDPRDPRPTRRGGCSPHIPGDIITYLVSDYFTTRGIFHISPV